jgi:mannose-6-phosphate isomerase-like protein (cupin superfamily)
MSEEINIYEEERPWGNFRRFIENTPSTVKIITIKANEELSLQSHNKRSEFWRVVSGSGVFYIDSQDYKVEKNFEQYVPVGSKHRIKAGPDGLEVLEISIGEFDEGDIVRYEDKYGRV